MALITFTFEKNNKGFITQKSYQGQQMKEHDKSLKYCIVLVMINIVIPSQTKYFMVIINAKDYQKQKNNSW